MKEPKRLTLAKELQALAQSGLTYSKDQFDIGRFERIREISTEMLEGFTDEPIPIIKDLFAGGTGYQTPKVDVRAVVFKDAKLLMVKERSDNSWALAGGWGDIGLTPAEVAVKEVREESGYHVQAQRLVAVMDKKCHNHPPSAYHTYKIFILCSLDGGTPTPSVETSEVCFFEKDKLPSLSHSRITEEQIKILFQYYDDPDSPAYFD
ncbi:ADP-ribose pyrophosphatase [Alteribacter lacisalsi]|uniref:ADP-ribose pyrophosphatase n=1 Tax=Alteribacter lacisalsi TaxID=2045244 RepID=A0A2W0H616_9BACI|nr:NUDIX hydrolase [Alteribacter lacisalsi]PYZ95560.1 ADP-ribose pyrophosphatase [Alteribacter lacisalsi]